MVFHAHRIRVVKLSASVIFVALLGAVPLNGSAKKQYRVPPAIRFNGGPADNSAESLIWNIQNVVGIPASVSVSPPTAYLHDTVTVTLQLSGVTSDDRDITYTSSADISNDLPRSQTVTAGYGTDHITFRVDRIPANNQVTIYADDGNTTLSTHLTINRVNGPGGPGNGPRRR